MKKGEKVIISYILIFISLLLVYPIIAFVFLNEPPIQIFINSIVIVPISFIFNLFIALFLLLAGIYFLSFLELRQARNAYKNARNRIGFIKDGQTVCFEGDIRPKEGWTPLLSPISQKESVLYCYGSKQIGGGTSQIKAVIKPSGDTIPLNGWLSGEYVEKTEYDPIKNNLQHLFSFMMERKDPNISVQDVSKAPNFYKIIPGTDERDTFENHEILNTLDEENFNKYKYIEIIIPTGMYGWVLGKWDDKNKQLLPLKFSGYIFVIQNDYKKSFLKYISKCRRKYLIITLSLILLSIMLSIPIFFPIISEYF